MPQYPYDYIPDGKKPMKDEETGEWSLVDLDPKKPADLERIAEEATAKMKALQSENKKLAEVIKTLEDSRTPGGYTKLSDKYEALLQKYETDRKELERMIESTKSEYQAIIEAKDKEIGRLNDEIAFLKAAPKKGSKKG